MESVFVRHRHLEQEQHLSLNSDPGGERMCQCSTLADCEAIVSILKAHLQVSPTELFLYDVP